MEHKLPPIYENSFVGIWKRMYVSGRPEQDLRVLIFNANGSAIGPIGPGSRVGGGTVVAVIPNPNVPEKGEIRIKYGRNPNPIPWSYTLNRNNNFKAEFNPFPGSNKTPPVLNELLLVGQGARHLYSFLSHKFKKVMSERDILQNVEP